MNNELMFKFTERDFLSVKEKLIEQDDYIQYLLMLLQELDTLPPERAR